MDELEAGDCDGPRGSLTKSFKHFAMDVYMMGKETIMVEKWFRKKEVAAVRTVVATSTCSRATCTRCLPS
jgi:ribosomal protein L6P/L9E